MIIRGSASFNSSGKYLHKELIEDYFKDHKDFIENLNKSVGLYSDEVRIFESQVATPISKLINKGCSAETIIKLSKYDVLVTASKHGIDVVTALLNKGISASDIEKFSIVQRFLSEDLTPELIKFGLKMPTRIYKLITSLGYTNYDKVVAGGNKISATDNWVCEFIENAGKEAIDYVLDSDDLYDVKDGIHLLGFEASKQFQVAVFVGSLADKVRKVKGKTLVTNKQGIDKINFVSITNRYGDKFLTTVANLKNIKHLEMPFDIGDALIVEVKNKVLTIGLYPVKQDVYTHYSSDECLAIAKELEKDGEFLPDEFVYLCNKKVYGLNGWDKLTTSNVHSKFRPLIWTYPMNVGLIEKVYPIVRLFNKELPHYYSGSNTGIIIKYTDGELDITRLFTDTLNALNQCKVITGDIKIQ